MTMSEPTGLRGLLNQATPGPWFYDSYATVHSKALVDEVECDQTGVAAVWAGTSRFNGGTATCPADARLIALAPDMARLLIDMADAMSRMRHDYLAAMPRCDCPHCRLIRPLLAGFAELDRRAAQ